MSASRGKRRKDLLCFANFDDDALVSSTRGVDHSRVVRKIAVRPQTSEDDEGVPRFFLSEGLTTDPAMTRFLRELGETSESLHSTDVRVNVVNELQPIDWWLATHRMILQDERDQRILLLLLTESITTEAAAVGGPISRNLENRVRSHDWLRHSLRSNRFGWTSHPPCGGCHGQGILSFR